MTGRSMLAGKVFLFIITAALICTVPASTQDLRMRSGPELIIPLADVDIFGLGGGGSLVFDTDLFGFLAPYLGLDFRYIAPAAQDLDSSLLLTSLGTGMGFFAFPTPRVKIGFSFGPGVYVGSYRGMSGTTMTGNVFWRAGAEAGFRVSPGLTLSASTSYFDYMAEKGSFFRGLALSLAADLGINSRSAEGRAVLKSAESSPIFPIVAPEYRTAQFGSAVIRNAESAEIRNVEVWFFIDGYTSGPFLCGRIPYLPRGAETKVPLYADFSDRVMTLTETTRTRGEIRIIYELLGDRRTSKAETTVTFMHRNALTWEDPGILAAFISPNDPAVLDSSKFVAGIVRSRVRSGLDSHFQYALGIFEGLRLSGISRQPDPQTPYSSMRSAAGQVDYVQYPHQTMVYRSGDSDDIAVLYAAALESVGVPAAVIPLDEEVLGAFRMISGESSVRTMFSDHGAFIFRNGEAWVPVRVSLLREGFLRAWIEGARLLKDAAEDGKDPLKRFYVVSDAWRRYPPPGVPGVSPAGSKPTEEQVRTAFEGVVSLVVAREIGPRADRMRNSFGPGGGTGRQKNALGVLYARYGMYREALAEFQAAYSLGELRAGINIGNVAFLMGDYRTAAEWFEKSLEDMPGEVAPIIGLARTYYELDRYEEADILFKRAAEMRPELADRYSYLSARVSGTQVRASAAMDRLGDMMWDE